MSYENYGSLRGYTRIIRRLKHFTTQICNILLRSFSNKKAERKSHTRDCFR